jgi:His/Glu/Gln/Arg/opine family amino acid ABC transporter permease subunit
MGGDRSVNFNWSLIWDYRFDFLQGLMTAAGVAVVALILSFILGMFIALARSMRQPIAFFASAYVNIFRGVPALVSVIWVYFGWSLLFGRNFSVYQAGVIALTLLYSAFLSEIFRAAFAAIPKGQREAGLALGMPKWRVFMTVTMPQSMKIALPNIGSMLIGMVKDTSTFTVIGLTEIVRVTQNLNSTHFQPFVLYSAAAVIYVVVAFALDFLFRTMEKVLATPTTGGLAGKLTARRRARIEAVIAGRSLPDFPPEGLESAGAAAPRED